jgi:PqqD family protein of HPr-rel-A system
MIENKKDFLIRQNNAITCHYWPDGCVVFNGRSGQTHLLNEMGSELFSVLSRQPITFAQFLTHLDSTFEAPENVRWDISLDELIAEYQNIGLLAVTEHHPS